MLTKVSLFVCSYQNVETYLKNYLWQVTVPKSDFNENKVK